MEEHEILDRISDPFFAVDEDWRFTYVNERAEQLLDRKSDDLDGERIQEAFPEATDMDFRRKYCEAMETQEPVTFEEYHGPLDRWFEVRAYPSETGLSVYFEDVTRERTQREKLEERDRVLREMYEVIADSGRSFTDQVEALLDIGRNVLGTDYGTLSRVRDDEYVFEVVQASDDSIQAGDVVPLSATNCERTVVTEETLVLEDVANDAPDLTGRAGFTEWGIACYLGAPIFIDEAVYGTFCFYDDEPREKEFSEWHVTLVDLMSRWISYELERERINERLVRQNDRLEQFASIVSHDLRNPLSIATMYLERADAECDSEHLAEVAHAHDRMEALITDLLTLAREGKTVADTEELRLSAVAEAAWTNVATDGAELRVGDDAVLRADEGRLRRALENLFRNAVEHGEEDVTVRVGRLAGGFYVEDDGPGIPDGDRGTVFEAGYSTREEGTGFGLAIVQRIVDAHDWTITVTDGGEGGARFEVAGVESA